MGDHPKNWRATIPSTGGQPSQGLAGGAAPVSMLRPRKGPPGATPPGVVTRRASPAFNAGQDTWKIQEFTEVSSRIFWKDNTSGGSARSSQTQPTLQESIFIELCDAHRVGQVPR